ncbi:MAG: hypothetical protein ACRCWI_03270 [Brevinema sp.]
MKRFVVLVAFFFFPLVFLSPQNIDFLVTAIEISEISRDTVVIRWNSTAPDGEFSLYYHNQAIRDQFILFDSQLIVRSNFIGISAGSIYRYEYRLTFKEPGNYFFAVVPNDTRRFDNIARTIVNEVIPTNTINLIPEMNITIQPISIRFIKQELTPDFVQTKYKTLNTTLTSLELKSSEDIFSLRWSVFPKDLSQYVFIIYRSRYPIVQYGTPKDLPEYARVTNQFSFEDKNIIFETPYYYAVVAENTSQWDSGINVFSQPAILLRKSPPFSIKPTVEYVKTRQALSLNRDNILSEEEIQRAVQQTLSNLHLAAVPVLRRNTISEILDSTTAPVGAGNPNLNLQESGIKLNNLSLDNYYNTNNRTIKDFMVELKKSEEKILKEEYSDFNNIVKEIADLSKKIEMIRDLEKKLLVSDRLSSELFKTQLSSYYDQIAQIQITQYRVQGIIKGLEQRRKAREQKFLELKKNQASINKAHNIFVLDREINRLQQSLKILEQNEINSLVQNLVSQVNKTDPKAPIGSLKNTEKNNNQIIITKERSAVERLIKEKQAVSDNFASGELLVKAIDIESLIDTRMERIQGYYQDISVEKVPNISKFTNEKWLVGKEKWLQSNKEIWLSKQELWKRRIQEILGSDYQRITSKWMNPSREVALVQGKKAFQDENFKEAAYLLHFASTDHNALMALGQSYYHLGAYRDAFTVFVTAFHMMIPESRYWMDLTAGKILERNL